MSSRCPAKIALLIASLAVLSIVPVSCRRQKSTASTAVEWPVYGGTPANDHYSPLKQINATNVSSLQVAWSYDTGEEGGLETNPLVVDGTLYAYTPQKEVIALDAATGKRLWQFASGVKGARPERGVSYWRDGDDVRIFAPVANFLYALDARTGRPVESFGDHGRIDLREHLRGDPQFQSIYLTSPGAIYKDLIIVGGAEPESLPAPPGDVRAYDCHTGKLRWTFHTIPHPGEFGYDTWPPDAWQHSGAVNNWAGMAIDQQRGIVYVPLGSASADWYGGDRVGDDLFGSSLVALNAETGQRIWHFQAVRHDLWDRDFPAPPALLTVQRDGKDVPAVAQTSKQGYLYVFNRLDGTPLFPMETRSYPASNVPGEVTAPTQVLPAQPVPFSRQRLTADLLTTRTPEAHRWALERFRTFISGGQFVPHSVGKDTVMFPGWVGGAEYGGPAVDPKTNIIYINANDDALTESLAKGPAGNGGQALYMTQCAICHGQHREGSPPVIPSLIDLQQRLTPDQILNVLQHGRGRMPSFSTLEPQKLQALTDLLSGKEHEETAAASGDTYSTTGYKMFQDPDGYPAVAAPWGTLNAIDLNTGRYVWKIPFGEYPELTAKGVPLTGSENFGGPVVTDGGLLIIAATVYDRKIRIYDKSSGKLLWEHALPFSAIATPSVYEVNGREYIVIASGGGRDHRVKTGGVYVAFALPAQH